VTTYLERNLAELYLDDLNLLGETTTTDGYIFRMEAQGDAASWGNPVPIVTSVQRWKTDGSVSGFTGWGNRNPSFKVFIAADTAEDLAAAERALVKAARSAKTLKWTPPAGDPDAATSVFDVQTCQVDLLFSPDDEMRLKRLWQVTIEAWPWVRSDDLTTFDALTTSNTPSLLEVDPCTSATGWTGSPYAASQSAGAVRITRTVPLPSSKAQTIILQLSRAGSVSGLASTPYIALDVATTGVAGATYTVTADGQPLIAAATFGTVTYWRVPASMSSFSTLLISGTFVVPAGTTPTVQLAVADVSKTDTPAPPTSTRRQLMRRVWVGGSVPTAGSLKVSSPSSTPLGNVILHSRVDDGSGLVPNMRQYWVSGGGTSTDTTAVSGQRELIVNAGVAGGVTVWNIPGGLLQEASYAVVARLSCSNTTTTMVPLFGAAALNGAAVSYIDGNSAVKFTAASVWGMFPLGVVTLPPAMMPGESQVGVRLQMLAASIVGTGSIYLDEIWLLDQTHGQVTIVNCGTTAGTATRLWVDAPDADPTRNRPAVYLGTQDDRSDAVAVPMASILSLGQHLIDPDGMSLFSVTDNVADARVSGSAYRRGHSHPGTRG